MSKTPMHEVLTDEAAVQHQRSLRYQLAKRYPLILAFVGPLGLVFLVHYLVRANVDAGHAGLYVGAYGLAISILAVLPNYGDALRPLENRELRWLVALTEKEPSIRDWAVPAAAAHLVFRQRDFDAASLAVRSRRAVRDAEIAAERETLLTRLVNAADQGPALNHKSYAPHKARGAFNPNNLEASLIGYAENEISQALGLPEGDFWPEAAARLQIMGDARCGLSENAIASSRGILDLANSKMGTAA
ncbi:hypothetical protein IPS27_20745 [Xanthomonas perforans]|uniref:hypothetical protein n=1 Tax=Xanthomonas perforans TaxID=442694 RepID=UPI000A549120|nr:hypothetical protein [Xanthomonas perforans]MBZ2461382.1 hypothetical protein [Xanthomonas perforans]MBZ2491376.1 hypothetical protein [Xanthomonas perforans]MBZ2495735.1 hypothetical protein [Xanthomonas perforans]MBZ2513264.1 hypothetical protein [Xanthomonas perforans]MBZ2526385.1 hypothetical protein [Xanthomonas perforans]